MRGYAGAQLVQRGHCPLQQNFDTCTQFSVTVHVCVLHEEGHWVSPTATPLEVLGTEIPERANPAFAVVPQASRYC